MSVAVGMWPLSSERNQVLSLPRGAKVLSVQEWNEQACVVVMYDAAEPPVSRLIGLSHNGEPVPGGQYVGSALHYRPGRGYRPHVFDMGEETP